MLPGSEQRLLCRRAMCHFYIMQSLPKYWLPIQSLKNMGLSKTGGHHKIASLGGNITDQTWKFSKFAGINTISKTIKNPMNQTHQTLCKQTPSARQHGWNQIFRSNSFLPLSSSQLNKIVPSTSSTDTISCQLHELWSFWLKDTQRLQWPTYRFNQIYLRFALAHPLHTEDPASTFYMITMLHPRIVEKWQLSEQRKKRSCWSK